MTFEEFSKIFPRNETIVGNFYQDDSFFVDSWDKLLDINNLKYNPFDYTGNSIPFMVYVPKNKEFEVWYFSYENISGYYTENGEDWSVMVYLDAFGYELYDPFQSMSEWIFGPPLKGQSRLQQILDVFLDKNMLSVFTNEDEFRKFVLEHVK